MIPMISYVLSIFALVLQYPMIELIVIDQIIRLIIYFNFDQFNDIFHNSNCFQLTV